MLTGDKGVFYKRIHEIVARYQVSSPPDIKHIIVIAMISIIALRIASVTKTS